MTIKFVNKYISIILFFISFSVSSQSNDWFTVAKKDVSYKSEKDVINLRGDKKEISQFKIKCTQGNLKIKDITVYYKDKTKNNKKTKGTGLLTKGMSSFVFNIEKGKIIDKIELSYEAIGNMLVTKRGKIELLGRKK